jgi:ABC-type nitrate/sulfonate/bicarbonate transport system substrate-binding protein
MSRADVRRSPVRPACLAVSVAAVLLAIALAPATAGARGSCTSSSPASLAVGLFTTAFLTTLAADAQGFVAEQGLTVQYLPVTSSTQQFRDLRDGNYDLILTSPDNVVDYRLNGSNGVGETFDAQIAAGLAHGQNLTLVVQPGIESYEDLRGGKLGVDSPRSGFAFAAYKMLREHGLERDVDYEVVPIGAGGGRLAAMLAGEIDATLTSGAFEQRLADEGFPALQSVQDVISPYLGNVVAGREAWLQANCGAVARLLRAYQDANRWVLDPANREQAIQLLMAQPNTTRSLAERLYAQQTTPGIGVIGDLETDRKGLLSVLELRQEFDGFDAPQNIRRLASRASGLYDKLYLKQASRLRGSTR